MQAYCNINKLYLADGLSFLGFHYYKYTKEDGCTVYTFVDTPIFRQALHDLQKLKQKYNS